MEEYDSVERLLKGVYSIYWASVCIWWIINYKFINPQYTKPIHFMLTFILVFRFLYSLFNYFITDVSYSSGYYSYFSLGNSSTEVIFSTLLYTILLLMSKGLNLTRDNLERQEISNISLLMGVIYLIFSIYTIDRDNLKFILIILLSSCLVLTHRNSSRVIRNLIQRHRIMRNYNFNRTLESTFLKLSMMKRFRLFNGLLFLVLLGCTSIEVAAYWLGLEKAEEIIFGMESIEEGCQAVCLLGIYIIFMPKFRGASFDLAEFENENEQIELAPMYEGKIQFDSNDGVEANKPFVLILPNDEGFDSSHPYSNVCIAMPLSLTFRRHSVDELQEPLISSRLNTY